MGIFKTSNGHGNLGKDRALLTVLCRCTDEADDETTSLLSGKGHHLTQPRRRRNSSRELRYAKTSDQATEILEEKVKEPDVVLDAGWKNVVPIVLCKSERCLSNHPLLPCNLEDFTPENGPVCSMCTKNIGFDGGLLSCRVCSWDICPDCNALRRL